MSQVLPYLDNTSQPQLPPHSHIYTEEEAQELVEKAYQEGWQQGMEEGYKLGKDKGYKENKENKVQEEEEETKKARNQENEATGTPGHSEHPHNCPQSQCDHQNGVSSSKSLHKRQNDAYHHHSTKFYQNINQAPEITYSSP